MIPAVLTMHAHMPATRTQIEKLRTDLAMSYQSHRPMILPPSWSLEWVKPPTSHLPSEVWHTFAAWYATVKASGR